MATVTIKGLPADAIVMLERATARPVRRGGHQDWRRVFPASAGPQLRVI